MDDKDFAVYEQNGQFIFGNVVKKGENYYLKTLKNEEIPVLATNLKKVNAILM